MQGKISPQAIYAALQQVLPEASPGAQQMYGHLPANWEDLSDHDKAILQEASWKANLVVSKFTSEEGQQ